jgi:Acetyltransferase (GNAT) domain
VQHTTIGDRPEVELLWFIQPDYWNRGYATEMAREAVRVAFDVLELADVISFTVDGNAASRAVMDKLGMTYERDIEHVGLAHEPRPVSGRRGQLSPALTRRSAVYPTDGQGADQAAGAQLGTAPSRRKQLSRRPQATIRVVAPRTSWERRRRGHADFRSARAMRKRATHQCWRSDLVHSRCAADRHAGARIAAKASAAFRA